MIFIDLYGKNIFSGDWSDQFKNNRSQHFMEQEGSKDNDDDDKTQN